MTSLGLRHGTITDSVICRYLNNRSHRVSGFTPLAGKLPNRKIFTAVNACDSGHRSDLSLIDNNNNYNNNNYNKRNDRTSIEIPRVSDTFDEWMHKSVTDIVKNLTQTPLLVQIYADGEVNTNKASPENGWTSTPSLEGVILVEELTGDTDPEYSGEYSDGVRVYGVLIQDKCRSTCYLLKTCSVNGGGLGFMCTHFCLMKVQSFHESVFSQFSDGWLVQ
ncbi:uncharacterized protein LOC143558840 [Bidens hawaiensis]|uniref:uncharacterized protein LOC143558840 n=1 Tax=Bidens hawaiensis TaxID=980011 RepID=UPI00404B9F4E